MNAHVPDPSKMTDFRRMDCNQLTASHVKKIIQILIAIHLQLLNAQVPPTAQ